MTPAGALVTRWRLLLFAAGASGLAAVALVSTGAGARAEGPDGEAPAPPAATVTAPATPAPPTQKETVRVVFKIYPPNRATVTWGKKKLGTIKPRESLVVQRPRDSGPLDVVVRAENCLPVHTRAYTFTDSTVSVKVTPLDKKNTIYGYKEEVPPEDGGIGGPDGGVP
jgi:hypothetical protein